MMSPLRLLAAAALLGGCAIDAPTGPGCTPERPCGDEIVDGVNLTQLVAAPLAGEANAARVRLAARTAAATGALAPRLVSVTTIVSPIDGAEIAILAGVRGSSTDTVFHAAVRRPPRAAGDVARRPVILVLPETPGAVVADDLVSQTGLASTLGSDVTVVALAGRASTLSVGARTFRTFALSAPLAPEPFLSDVDDAQTLLAGLRTIEFLADPARLAAVGLGRGGTSALLLRARGAVTPAVDVDLVVAFGAPTSWFVPSALSGFRARLGGGGSSSLPDFESVYEGAVAPLRAGTIGISEARLRLLERSPAPLLVPPSTAPEILRVLGVYATLDTTVPADQAGALGAVLAQTGAVLTVENVTRADLRTDLTVVGAVTREMTERLGL